MRIENVLISGALAIAMLTAPAIADDCAAVKTAMLNSGHTPHSVVVTKVDGQGKKTVARLIQTVDNKYVQTPGGKWYAMNIAMKDLDDDTSGLLMCHLSGRDSVGGEAAAIYEVHMNLEGEIQDQSIWVSSNNRVLKIEGAYEGIRHTTEYDYVHATPPVNAISIGGK